MIKQIKEGRMDHLEIGADYNSKNFLGIILFICIIATILRYIKL